MGGVLTGRGRHVRKVAAIPVTQSNAGTVTRSPGRMVAGIVSLTVMLTVSMVVLAGRGVRRGWHRIGPFWQLSTGNVLVWAATRVMAETGLAPDGWMSGTAMAVTGIASFTVLFSTRVRRRQAQAQAHWDGLKPENRDGGLLRAQVAARTVSGGARARITANAGRIDGNDERLARMEADQVQMETRLVRVETRIEGMFELLLGAVTAAGLQVPSVVDTVPMRRLTLVRDEDAS